MPAPLAPRKIFVCPVCSVKLTSRRMTFSSNARCDAVEDDDRPAEGRGPRRAAADGSSLCERHQYINTMRSFVTRKSTAITATELATTALVVARPTPCVPPRRPQADVAADAHDREPEEERLDEAHPDVLDVEALHDAVPVDAPTRRGTAATVTIQPPTMPTPLGDDGQQRHHHDAGEDRAARTSLRIGSVPSARSAAI